MKHGHRLLIGALVTVALMLALALTVPGGQDSLAQGDIIYVDADATGLNDGSTWDNAYTDLQTALDVAGAGAEIWVAEGIYTPSWPSDPSDPRSATFQLKNGVALYGGFDPSVGAIGWENRNWVLHEAVLSGDIGIEGDVSDNSYHVFYHPSELALDGSAVLDGFTVTAGNANGPDNHVHGGGMLNYGSSPTVLNCTFSGNSADIRGGGMCNYGSSPVVTNSIFSGNSAGDHGGGMFNGQSSSAAVTNCTFSDNSAAMYGGGMCNWDSSPAVTNCTFSDNLATNGGGMSNVYSSAAVTNCIFSGNSAAAFATYGGGGMSNIGSSPAVTNCTFSGNSTNTSGGGMLNRNSSPVVTNCILWGDSPDGLYNDTSEPAVTYSDIHGGYSGVGNIDADPQFVDPANGDFHLGPGSPCIDAGNNAAPDLPDSDFEGDARILDGDRDGTAIVDMGVDEYETGPIFVDLEAAGASDGSSWVNAFTTLQSALDVAIAGAEIWVAEGIYTPSWPSDPSDPRSATFQLKNGVALYGGFDPSVGDTGWEDRDWVNNVTVLSGNIGDPDTSDDNSYHVFYHPAELALDGSAVLDGFTISGGNASADDSGPNGVGGGMLNYGSSPAVSNCTFSGNSARVYGGGICNSNSSPVVINCTFSDNSAYGGGGMYNYESSPAVTNCTFSSNSASYFGGGMGNMWYSSPVVTNCTFSGNSASYYGGGMYSAQAGLPTVTNSILWDDNPDEVSNYNSQAALVFTDIQGGYDGEGNIDADPLFVDAANGDFHLGSGSPCIDAGNNDAPNLPDFDFEGDARIVDRDGDGIATVDMGVDEFALEVPVEIDIKPGDYPNSINLGSEGVVPVAILTTDEFDADIIDPVSVLFAGASPLRWAIEDVGSDGDLDLVFHFNAQELGLDGTSTEATLTGQTFDGMPIQGTDTVRIVP